MRRGYQCASNPRPPALVDMRTSRRTWSGDRHCSLNEGSNDVIHCHIPVSHGLEQYTSATFNATSPGLTRSRQNSQHIVAVNTYRVYAIPGPTSSDAIAKVLLRSRGRDGESVVPRNEQRWRWQSRSEEHSGMKVAFRRSTISEVHRSAVAFTALRVAPQSVGNTGCLRYLGG